MSDIFPLRFSPDQRARLTEVLKRRRMKSRYAQHTLTQLVREYIDDGLRAEEAAWDLENLREAHKRLMAEAECLRELLKRKGRPPGTGRRKKGGAA